MHKKIACVLCAAALLAGLLAVSLSAVAASPSIYILAVNDKFVDLPTLPETVNGVIYVPYQVFDKDVTGVDLGVRYGIRRDPQLGPILNLYQEGDTLVFMVNQGTCNDQDGREMNFRALLRSGVIYVPVNAVCSFFGLQYTLDATADRGSLVRICNSSATLSSAEFLRSGSSAMLSRYTAILRSLQAESMPVAVSTPAPTPTPRPTPTPTSPPQGITTKEDVTVYLAVDASQAASDLTTLFPDGVRVLFLFTPDSLPAQSALVRKAVAAGHSIGLIVDGSAEEALEQLEQGNRLLTHIARVRTRMVSAPASLTTQLSQAGWLCWTPNVTGDTAAALLSSLNARRTAARLTLPPSTGIITQLLTRIQADHYDLRQPLETGF